MANSHSRPLGEDECVSEAVLEAVAAASEQSRVALPPLQEAVDTEFVDRLFVTPTTIRSVRFSYAGYDVVVGRDGIRVH